MNHTKKRNKNYARPSKRRSSGGKRNMTSINPDQLMRMAQKPVKEIETPEHQPAWQYEATSLSPAIKANLARLGYTTPTPIQEQTVFPAIDKRDVLGIAGTGTGKTAAFLIPIISQLLVDHKNTRALVVVPTRELALQVDREFQQLSKGMQLKASCFIGGTKVNVDLNRLRKLNHIIIGTPGRLLDLAYRKALKLNDFSTLVLDEFDRMLDMGFLPDVQKILAAMSSRQQTMFFSATIEKSQRELIGEILTNPVEAYVSQGYSASDQVQQEVIRLENGSKKFDVMLDMIREDHFKKVLIFAETKRVVNQLDKQLYKSGIRCDVIHGNKTQNYRVKALKKFTDGKVQVLVATDVAARGLDVSDVSHVINYQLPRTMDSYIHRIGRTGRAGKQGTAITFVD
ncbi:MAG TPA: ATP-dependent helicase [Cytophagales bacterium]|jgi:ATP-dependent RNA helicase RhlE|nr:ATP-dependent helicase [Cytophagales bacterium]